MLPTIIAPLLDAPCRISHLLWHIAEPIQERANGGGICESAYKEQRKALLRWGHATPTAHTGQSVGLQQAVVAHAVIQQQPLQSTLLEP